MRIGLIMPFASPWSRQFALRLIDKGHDVHILEYPTRRADNAEINASVIAALMKAASGVNHETDYPRNLRQYLIQARRIRSYCRKCSIDILLPLSGGGPALLAYLSGVRPFTVYVGGSDVLLVRGLKRRVTQTVLSAASIVFSNGQYLAEKTCQLAPRANIVPLYLGVDTDRFSPTEDKTDRPVRIVCARWFEQLYNNEYLIQALSEMPADLPEYQVIFTASGSGLDNARALADRLLTPELRAQVSFLGGASDAVLRQSVRDAHIYVSLSRSDGTSIALLEALSCGLYPVLSDIPQNREWIDGKNGVLVPFDKPAELARELAHAISNTELRKDAAIINRNMILERGDSEKSIVQLVDILQSIVDE